MKKILIFTTFIFTILCFSCNTDEKQKSVTGEGELNFYPYVQEFSRRIGNDFFEEGHGIDVSVYTSKTGSTPLNFIYEYDDNGIFVGKPEGFRFSLDDTYIDSLIAIWPTSDMRASGFVTDQRELSDFKLADWLTAKAEVKGVMPTDTPVPLNFVRENTMLEFELAGQNSQGLKIESLIIELQIEGNATACWAYCGDPNGHAYLILEAGMAVKSGNNYLIGRLNVTDQDTYTVIFPDTDLILQAGTRYLVTLTAQGYDVDGFVYIATFRDALDPGIGIPFQQPDPIDSNNFRIDTLAQLIAMSYLIRHYVDSATFQWPEGNYVVSSSFDMTDEEAELYIPVPRVDFFVQVTQNGVVVDSLPYGAGNYLQLFTTD